MIESIRGGGERVTVYDWLRLIATIYVVIGHSAYLNIQSTFGGIAYELPETLSHVYNSPILTWYRSLVGWVYGFHMPLFFMLSGAVLALKPMASFDNIMKAKIKRLLIPYYIYGWFFMLPVKRMADVYDNVSLKSALKGFLSGIDSGHLWFLTALFWCIVIFVVCKKILLKFDINSSYALLMICGIIQLLENVYLPFDILGLRTSTKYIFYFALGYAFEGERSRHEQWNMKKTLFLYAVLLVLEIVNRQYDLLNSFFVIMAGSSMTYLTADICDRFFVKCKEQKWWKVIMRNLFYVYLLHDPLEYMVLKLFIKRGWLSAGFGCVMYTVSRTVIIFIVTIILGECIREIKKILDNQMNGMCRYQE